MAPAERRTTYSVEDGVATITLNRPEKRNALDGATVAEVREHLREADRDGAVRVIALRGAGPDFCAGADLAEMEKIASNADAVENLSDASELGEIFVRIRRMEKPVVAVVHGNAIAGGAGLATACDLVLAHEEATFGYPEVHLGFVPAMVMTILRRVVGEKVAFELVVRGDRIGAAEAMRLGVVNRVFDAETFNEEAGRYLVGIARRPATAVRLIKRLFYGMDNTSFEESIARGAEMNALARMTDETRAGVRRFLDKRGGE